MIDLQRALGPIYRRIMLMVGRGTLSLTDDGAGQQRMQVELLDGETRDVADRVQQYGISSHPPAGSHVVVLNVGGQRDHPIIIGADDPGERPTGLAAGEVMLWSQHGQRVHLQADGGALVTSRDGHRLRLTPGGGMEIDCDGLTIRSAGPVVMETPSLQVTGDIIDSTAGGGGGMTMAAMREIYNEHVHPGEVTVPPQEQMA